MRSSDEITLEYNKHVGDIGNLTCQIHLHERHVTEMKRQLTEHIFAVEGLDAEYKALKAVVKTPEVIA